MEGTLHPTPRWREVVLEQIRIVALRLRPAALMVAAVIGVATLVIGNEIIRGGPGSDTDEAFPTAVISFFLPFAVWRGERRFGPAFLWTLPVDRRRLALAKVLAGWVWMMAALAVFVVWLLALALLSDTSPVQMATRVPFIATTGAYLLGSALVLGLRHPLRWVLGAAGVVILVATFIQPFELRQPLLSVFSAIQHARAGWRALPELAQWATTTFLWLGAGLAALWAAASRHRERRQ
jgi:hypothetical protein